MIKKQKTLFLLPKALFNFLMIKKISIVDYGLGNIYSAKQSFLKVINDNDLNANVVITNKPEYGAIAYGF